MTEIEITISKGKTLRNKLLAMLHSHGYSSGPKNNLLVAYTDIAIEHHESIYYLIDSNLYGSAFSLVRSLFETLFRIHWVNKCASDEQIEKIYSNDHFHFPKMHEIVTVIDKSYAGDNFFIDIKRNSWSAMCSYAHSGLLPISRRFTNGDISPNYDGLVKSRLWKFKPQYIGLLFHLYYNI